MQNFKQQIQNCMFQFVTLSTENGKRLLRTGFKRTAKWNIGQK